MNEIQNKIKILTYLMLTLMPAFMLTIIVIQPANAGPVSEKYITYSFSIPEKITKEWQIYFLSVGEFENTNISFNDTKIIEEYIFAKEKCGQNGTFFREVYEMNEEERKHKGCTINGTYQKIYCFRTVTNKPECERMLSKLDYNNEFSFQSFFDSLMWDINRSSFYNHIQVSPCLRENNICSIVVNKKQEPYNPFIVVLENNEDVFFSEKIKLPVEVFYNDEIFYCEPAGCDVNYEINISLQKFIAYENKLDIEFNYFRPIMQKNIEKNVEKCSDVGFFEKIKNLFYDILGN